MSSPIDICNLALAHIGDRRISRLDEDAQDSDALVRYCSEFYNQARGETLAAHRWTFAKKTETLSRRTDVLTIGYSYAHQLPTKMVRLMRLVPGYETRDGNNNITYAYHDSKVDKFKIVGQQVWSNEPIVALEYITDTENPED